jgi:hypothetical protein
VSTPPAPSPTPADLPAPPRPAAALIAAGAALAAAVVLYVIEPGEGTYYPQCALFRLTGLHCPGCGATRCAHALLHGRFAQAAAYNLLVAAAAPVVLLWLAGKWWGLLTGGRWRAARIPQRVGLAILAVWAVFGVLRNLPFAPFDQLAPHTLP